MPKIQAMGNLALAGFDDIFGNPTAQPDGERIIETPLTDLYSPEFHPFNVFDDEAMNRLVNKIKKYGVNEPGLARPRKDGGYELLCGNRRKRACELANLSTMPVIIRDLDDKTAAIIMIDSNLEQRDKLLYSEKAWAYRVTLEALNHGGIKGDGLSVDVLVDETGESKTQIFRFVRLTELIPDLIDKVDAKKLAFNPGVALSYLTRKEQAWVVDAMAKYEIKPNLSQAVQLKKKKGTLTADEIDKILSENKKVPKDKATGLMSFRKFFPTEYSQEQIYAAIIKLLKEQQTGVAV